eukprot:1150502-Pelagomonas_calceolata.AAC.6
MMLGADGKQKSMGHYAMHCMVNFHHCMAFPPQRHEEASIEDGTATCVRCRCWLTSLHYDSDRCVSAIALIQFGTGDWTYVKIETIQSRLAWPLRKDDIGT